jgi:hypothetical protein
MFRSLLAFGFVTAEDEREAALALTAEREVDHARVCGRAFALEEACIDGPLEESSDGCLPEMEALRSFALGCAFAAVGGAFDHQEQLVPPWGQSACGGYLLARTQKRAQR